MTLYYQWHLQQPKKKAYLVERSVLDTKLSNYANSTSILFDTNPVPSDKLTSAVLVSTEESPNEIYAYYTDEEQTSLVFAPKDKNIVIYAPDNCYQLFYSLQSVTQIDFDNFNTSNVTNMSAMFLLCQALTSLDLSNFNTSNVTNMELMFMFCQALTSLDVSSFDTSSVTNMSDMFNSCQALASLDLSNFNTSSVTNMSYMFSDCQALELLDLSSFDTSNVTNMRDMFIRCQALTSLDLSSFDTSNVTNMSYMFAYCQKLTSFTVGNNFTMDTVAFYTNYMRDTGANVPNYNSSYVYAEDGTAYSRSDKLPNGANTYYTYVR